MPSVSIATLVAGARSGYVVSFPTDTVPALGAIAAASGAIYTLKQRDPQKPLILMAATWQELGQYLDLKNAAAPLWQAMAAKYLPGAVTLVLPSNSLGRSLNLGMTSPMNSLGVRIPNSKMAIAILQQTGALLTTSANQSGAAPIRQLAQISQAFPQVLVAETELDRDELGSGLPSTVLAWTTSGWQVLRQGAVKI